MVSNSWYNRVLNAPAPPRYASQDELRASAFQYDPKAAILFVLKGMLHTCYKHLFSLEIQYEWLRIAQHQTNLE